MSRSELPDRVTNTVISVGHQGSITILVRLGVRCPLVALLGATTFAMAWDGPPLLNHTAVACGRAPTTEAARRFSSPCPGDKTFERQYSAIGVKRHAGMPCTGGFWSAQF